MNAFKEWLKYHFFEQKLKSPIGILLLIGFGLLIGYLNVYIDYRGSLGLVGLFLIALLVVSIIVNPYFGLYFILAYSALPPLLGRLLMNSSVSIPFGNLIDVLDLVLFFSIITKPNFYKSTGKIFWGTPISFSFLLLLFFYIIEALNPSMFSLLGWLSYIRNYMVLLMLFFNIFCLLNTWKKVKFFIYFNITLTTILAMYACKQQWIGLFDFENRWATSNPNTYQLLFQGGFLRKWSTLSDPASSGILFSTVALQCIALLVNETRRKSRILLAIAMLFNLFGYTYSGTRTATVVLVAGICFYGIATFYEKKTRIFLVIATSLFILLMVSPYSPSTISRIKSTFEGSKDASAALRDLNRHTVQPYLYQHPLGGGIYTCGAEGPKYNPGHYLMKFQPDSGYMKVFAEQGWIGLLMMLIGYFLILSFGIRKFYRIRSPDLQKHSIALITMVFGLMVGQYSQIAISQYPDIAYYIGALAIIVRIPYFDQKPGDTGNA